MKRTLLAVSVAAFLCSVLTGVVYAAPDPRREELLRVIVRGAPIELRDMKVIFDDDSVFDVARRSRILRENSDFVIDLPGERRVIKRIDFQYRSVDRREGKATVLVYGRH